jgi:uncharacterized protein
MFNLVLQGANMTQMIHRIGILATVMLLMCRQDSANALEAAVQEKPESKQHEMTMFQLVFLLPGSEAAKFSPSQTAELRQQHGPYLNSLGRSGKGVIAGPFTDGGSILGALVLNASAEEAKELISNDPLVKAGFASVEIHPWYAENGIMKFQELPREMKTYYFGLLVRGPKAGVERTQEEAERLQKAHMAHINKTAESGKLVIAGPLGDNGRIRGILIYKVDSLREANALAEGDPAVQAGRLAVEMHPWSVAEGSLP